MGINHLNKERVDFSPKVLPFGDPATLRACALVGTSLRGLFIITVVVFSLLLGLLDEIDVVQSKSPLMEARK
jgi:hypothetical protein